MRKVIHKFWGAWDFDREEVWLNELAAQGWALVGVGFCRYEFEACEPGTYTIRLQLLENVPSHPASMRYLNFLEETGVEQVGSWLRWVYLRKRRAEGDFELFSDNTSKIRHLSLIITLLLFLTIANLCIGVFNLLVMLTAGSGFNLIGGVNLAIGILGLIGTRRLISIRRGLQDDQNLFE